MTPELLALLIQSAIKVPTLYAEIKALTAQHDVTDAQWSELEETLKRDPESYFAK